MALSPPDGLAADAPPPRAWKMLGVAATLFLVTAFWWVVYAHEVWREPALMARLGGTMAIQVALHWLFRGFAASRLRLALYFVLQLGLVLVFGATGRSDPWMYQFLLMLLVEAVAVLRAPRAQLAAAAAQVAAAVVAAHWLFGPGALVRALMHSIPMAASIVGFGMLYQRLSRSEERARRAHDALDAAHGRLVVQAGELERLTVAAERQRLARELHDTLAQGLVGLTLQLEAVDARLERGDLEKARAIVRRAAAGARTTLADARTAITDLRQGAAAPLAEALREEAERFSRVTGIPCALDVSQAIQLGDEASLHAVRCVAEGLTNVARHARATRASIRVTRQEGAVFVELADDGVGFATGAAENAAGHYGLLGIEERARLAGGGLEIRSRPGAGTVLRLRLPAPEGGAAA